MWGEKNNVKEFSSKRTFFFKGAEIAQPLPTTNCVTIGAFEKKLEKNSQKTLKKLCKRQV
jgi:hypothetical protein